MKTKATGKSKALATTDSKKSKKELVWAGGQALMGKVDPNDTKAFAERNLMNVVSQVLQVSPFGVNILGGQPYLNNLGRKQKLKQFDPDVEFEYDWKQPALDDTMKALCMARLVDKKGKALTPWVLGEASNKTMSMSTLHGYQNHMAQTRAENRVIQHKYGVRIHEDMLQNIKLLSMKAKTEEEKLLLQQAAHTNTSAGTEEIVMPPKPGSEDPGMDIRIVLTNEEEAKLMKHVSRLYKVEALPGNKRILELEKVKKEFAAAKVKEKWNDNMHQYMVGLYKEVLNNATKF